MQSNVDKSIEIGLAQLKNAQANMFTVEDLVAAINKELGSEISAHMAEQVAERLPDFWGKGIEPIANGIWRFGRGQRPTSKEIRYSG